MADSHFRGEQGSEDGVKCHSCLELQTCFVVSA